MWFDVQAPNSHPHARRPSSSSSSSLVVRGEISFQSLTNAYGSTSVPFVEVQLYLAFFFFVVRFG